MNGTRQSRRRRPVEHLRIVQDNGAPETTDDATELALAREVCRRHAAEIRYNVTRGDYLTWTGSRWERDDTGQVARWTKATVQQTRDLFPHLNDRDIASVVKRMQSAAGIGGIMRLVQTEPGIPVTAEQLDRDPFLLNVGNGTLDLHTGQLRPHRWRDLITKQIPTEYHPDAPAPLWDAFLLRVMDGRETLVRYLQRVVGLALTGCIDVQELFILYGIGANGKSVFFETACDMLGEYAGTAPDSLLIARDRTEHPTEIADLLGKRLVVASETENGGKLRLALVKKLTGDARIKARFMRCDYFEFTRTHKTWLVTNHRPRVSENTEAAWRRIRLIPFSVIIPPDERDPALKDKLRAEFPGILAWAVRGCIDWQQNGMNPHADVLLATDEYRAEADTFSDYVTERLILGEFARVTRADLWRDYESWALKSSDRLDRSGLYERIRQLDGVAEGATKGVKRFDGVGLCFGSNTVGGCR